MDRIRLALADDHPTLLGGLESTLEADYEIAGTYSDGRALVEGVQKLRPDAVILDISMPELSGLKAAARIKEVSPETRILFFTMHNLRGYEAAARRTGAQGIVLKSATPEILRAALERILKGFEYWPSEMNVPETDEPNSAGAEPDFRHLTSREQEVLQLIASGHSAKEIAYRLSISIWTVTFHRQQIKKKLGLASTADLTRFAIEQGMIE